MDESRKEKTIDIAVMLVMGLVTALPIILYIASTGMFGKIALLGKSDFSPWMDRMLLLGTSFWVMYACSWFVPELRNRAPRVFGCTALFAILSIVIIQFDNVLIPPDAPTPIRDAANIWFFNLPYYAMRVFDTGMLFSRMSFLVMGLMLLASGALLWWIKNELAGAWKRALLVWFAYESSFFAIAWLMSRIFGPVMFRPQSM